MAYVSQEAWIFSSSVRDNVLFGLEYEPEWYDTVIEACALKNVRRERQRQKDRDRERDRDIERQRDGVKDRQNECYSFIISPSPSH